MHKPHVEALDYYLKNPKKILLFMLNDAAFGVSIFLWYILLSPSFDIVKTTQNASSFGWKAQALATVGIYAIGLILLFGFFF